MKLDDILDSWSADSNVDRTELAEESMKIPQLHSKYLKMFSNERMRLKQLDFQHKQLVKLKTEFYLGTIAEEDLKENNWEPNPLRILKADIPMYIDADPDIIELLQKKALQQEKVDTLDSIIRSINNRGFQIKNAIDWIRFTNGG